MTKFNRGAFVELTHAPYDTWGVGKILAVEGGGGILVEYFDSPGNPKAQVARVEDWQLKPFRVPPQTRVYRQSGSRWQVGRVLEDEGQTLFVQFPNSETVNVDRADLFLRWNRPLLDPLPLLCAQATETPLLADARSAFLEQVMRQRSAAQGIPAILSSSIELQDYQFEVARRVLTDPIQRYLLADEVGLGKTVEAGIILRQHFLDDEQARAVLVVPTVLINQWRNELRDRFGLGSLLDDSLHIVSHDDIEQLRDVIDAAGMLVVDEAHHLSRRSSPPGEQLYELLQLHCTRIRKLLLLSATPVLADEQGFLRVLHLLDPDVFRLDDFEGFQRRVASRQLIAEVVTALEPQNLWGLPPELDRLEAAHHEDALLVGKIASLRSILDEFPTEEDERYLAALADLRVHLQESYKLHRRLLRNRRSTLSWATIGRAGGRSVEFQTNVAVRHRELWESLRHTINELGGVPESLALQLASAALHVGNRVSVYECLKSNGYTDAELLRMAQLVDRAAQEGANSDGRIDALVREIDRNLQTPDLQVVVFCDHRSDADRAAEALKDRFGDLVERHEVAEDPLDDEGPQRWEAFLDPRSGVRVLVCDARAEEGVNLHGGRKCAVHFDLPLSPNRIEQRIGRLDRFGKGDRVFSIMLVDEGNPDQALWANILDSGWRVFDRSVASLQYLIESSSRELALAWLHHGRLALEDQLQKLAGPEGLVAREIREIDRQDALDALSLPDETSTEELQDCDDEWRLWRQAFEQFALVSLKFQQNYELGAPSATVPDPPFRMGYVYRGHGAQTLIAQSSFIRHFLQGVDRQAVRGGANLPLSHRYVYSRRNVTSRAAVAQGTHLLRVGDPLVTALEQFCETDDRGRAFGVWRVDRGLAANDECGADLFFRFDFILRHSSIGGTDQEQEAAQIHAHNRKAVSLFPPRFVRVWVDGSGQALNADAIPERLALPYVNRWEETRRDFNLNAERWRRLPAQVRATWLHDWPGLCQARRTQAEASVLVNKEVQRHIEAAVQACEKQARLAQAQHSSRMLHVDPAARERESREHQSVQAMYAALRNSFRTPALELDVVGAFFLASETLEEG